MTSDRETLQRRRRNFEAALRANDPQWAEAKLAVVDRLIEVSEREPGTIVADTRKSEQSTVGFLFRATGRLLWRSYPGGPTRPSKIVLLECREEQESDRCRETRSRVNELQVERPLTAPQEIRVRLHELCDSDSVERFVAIVTDLIRSADSEQQPGQA